MHNFFAQNIARVIILVNFDFTVFAVTLDRLTQNFIDEKAFGFARNFRACFCFLQ